MAENKVRFLRGTAQEYANAVKDDDTFYYTTDDEKFYVGSKEITGGGITVDSILSDTSENPVQNKIVKKALDDKANIADIPTSLPANGGNADTVDGLHADNFIQNTSDRTPMKFEITYGNHTYMNEVIDNSIPIMPKECNYTFIVSRLKSDNSIKNIIAIPADYDDDVTLYQVGTGVWKNVADGGTASTISEWGTRVFPDLNNAELGFSASCGDAGHLNAPNSFWSTVLTTGPNTNATYRSQFAIPWSAASNTQKLKYRTMDNGDWYDWKEIYTSGNKPYVTGSVTVAANTSYCATNHGFMPSGAIWWCAYSKGVGVLLGESGFDMGFGYDNAMTVNYLIFK